VSNHRSPLARIPLEKLYLYRGDLLVYQEHAATSSPQDDPFTSALDDPILVSLPGHLQAVPDPRSKIPPSQWGTVLQRVEQGEPLRHIARDYGVSYETVRRVLRAARRHSVGRVSTDHPPSQ
jgi:Helix-turn-helix domain of resolvase